jgi:hypothetical protein
MFRAVRPVTAYIPAIAIQLNIVTYKHVVNILRASAVFGHLQEGNQQRKITK